LFEGLGNFVHLVAAVLWIGGLFVLVAGIRPALSKALPSDPERERILALVHRRFSLLSLVAASVLFASGFMMMTQNERFEGFGHYQNTWSKILVVKHALFVALLVPLLLLRKARPVKIEKDLIDLSLMLGLAILLATGLLTAAR